MADTTTQSLPLVSVVMPTHNAARFIGKSIRSVLEQTYPNWELIIVDDASSDDTENIVNAFPDPRIQYHKSARIGHPAGVRNQALRMAKGELIAFLDSDDLYYPETLEKLSRPLLQNSRLTAVYGFAFSMDEHENPLPPTVALIPASQASDDAPPYELPSDYSHSWENIATSNISCLLPALMLRRSAWEKIGFFNETLCGPEDYEFYVRMYLHDYEGVYCLSDFVYRYRVHAASLTKSPEHYERLLSSCIRIMDWMFNEAPVPAEVQAYKSRAYVACYRYLARERLLHHQPAIARKIALMALRDPNISFADFVRTCGPLLVRSFLPSEMDSMLVQWKKANMQPQEAPAV